MTIMADAAPSKASAGPAAANLQPCHASMQGLSTGVRADSSWDKPQDRENAIPDFDAIVIGAGMSGLYQLYRLRELGLAGARVRGRHRRRRHLVLEPLSRRALRFRELFLRLLLLARSCWRNGTGPSISPPSRRPCAISTTSPTSSTCAATSSSAAGSRRRTTRRRRAAGTSRWRTAAATARAS